MGERTKIYKFVEAEVMDVYTQTCAELSDVTLLEMPHETLADYEGFAAELEERHRFLGKDESIGHKRPSTSEVAAQEMRNESVPLVMSFDLEDPTSIGRFWARFGELVNAKKEETGS